MLESGHWIELLKERKIITNEEADKIRNLNTQTLLKLNSLIKSQYNRKSAETRN